MAWSIAQADMSERPSSCAQRSNREARCGRFPLVPHCHPFTLYQPITTSRQRPSVRGAKSRLLRCFCKRPYPSWEAVTVVIKDRLQMMSYQTSFKLLQTTITCSWKQYWAEPSSKKTNSVLIEVFCRLSNNASVKEGRTGFPISFIFDILSNDTCTHSHLDDCLRSSWTGLGSGYARFLRVMVRGLVPPPSKRMRENLTLFHYVLAARKLFRKLYTPFIEQNNVHVRKDTGTDIQPRQ